MECFDDDSYQAQAYAEFVQAPQKAQLGVGIVAGAAAYESCQEYSLMSAKPDSFAKARAVVAEIASNLVDKMVATEGLTGLDVSAAKAQAIQALDSVLDRNYYATA